MLCITVVHSDEHTREQFLNLLVGLSSRFISCVYIGSKSSLSVTSFDFFSLRPHLSLKPAEVLFSCPSKQSDFSPVRTWLVKEYPSVHIALITIVTLLALLESNLSFYAKVFLVSCLDLCLDFLLILGSGQLLVFDEFYSLAVLLGVS